MSERERDWQELCDSMLAMGQNLQLTLEMSRTDKRKNLVIILYSHLLNLFQQVVEKRLHESPEVLQTQVRELLDAAFATVAAVHHRTLVDDFYTANDRQRIFRRKIHQSLPRNVAGRIQLLSGSYFAEVADLSDYYSGLRERVDQMPSADKQTEIDRLMIPATESLLLGTRQVADFFDLHDLEKEYYKCWQGFLGMSETTV